MKRKIYQTPHGRVIVKMQPAVNNNHKLQIKSKLYRHLYNFPIGVKSAGSKVEIESLTRRQMEKIFRRFDQQAAEAFIRDTLDLIPAAFRTKSEDDQ